MTVLTVALAWLGMATALLLITLWVRRFPALPRLGSSRIRPEHEAESLTVVVPVRNEANNIGRCLTGLLTQTYPFQRMEILVVDDNSTDDTASIVRRIAGSDTRVKLLEAGPLPAGWTGKSHACWRGAMATQGEWLCFVDADTVAAPGLISTAVDFAQANGIDLLSLLPFMELGSLWERLIFPSVILAFSFMLARRRINDPATPAAVACGAFILIRRHAYDFVEGHVSVRAEILEDVRLACRVKQAGYRVYLMRGDELIHVRMYTDLREIWDGFSKNEVDGVGGISGGVLVFVWRLLVAWVPIMMPVLLWACWVGKPTTGLDQLALGLALIGSAEAFGAYALAVTTFGLPIWYGLLIPLGLTMRAAIMLTSMWRLVIGKTTWRGRTYPLRKMREAAASAAGLGRSAKESVK